MIKDSGFRSQKTIQLKSVPKMEIVGNVSVWILNIVIGTPERHFLTRNDVF